VRVERQRVGGAAAQTLFVVRLDLGQGLSQRERAILMGTAKHCEVHKLLTGAMRFEYGWTEEAGD